MAEKLTPKKLLEMVERALKESEKRMEKKIDDKIAELKKPEIQETPLKSIEIRPADFKLEFMIGGSGDTNDQKRKDDYEELAHKVVGLMIDKKVNKLIIYILKKFE